MQILMRFLALIACLAMYSCGGGGGTNSEPTSVVIQAPPVFESPHPEIWETQPADEAGFNQALLSEAFDYAMQDGSFSQASLLIKDGKLVEERYRGITDGEVNALVSRASEPGAKDPKFWRDNYGARDADSLVTSWSTAKSFTSVLVGIAVEKGFINSTDQIAADFITEWQPDARSTITIEQLLDMRSGLAPACFSETTETLGECEQAADSEAGGNIVFHFDQMTACIDRSLAIDGAAYVWARGGSYQSGEFVYSNCDTQVLGEILFRATGQDPATFAQQNLFEPLNISAFWWRDNVANGQANGNYLTYCCIDSTARDFAKFGYLIQLGALELEGGREYSNYISELRSLSDFYGKQFWSFCAETDNSGTCLNRVIHTSGFDGQFILIDLRNQLVIVRASLYKAYLNLSDERKMRLTPGLVSQSNWAGSVPAAMAVPVSSSFSIREFHSRLISALQ